ncbi:hypothetical protein PTSG_06955 [Salpingoeca rosetta]|uniref:Uncharacterized protein n=1 Tax=Salpingoeca rosetta (strain ATCC 50818 / BSB-021) TaxID=946362 RepID=F2UFA5_SALR5|nr:uncharacterized protein PTSG_06955 [Salpingoeca rosetta]EGD75305.1 hypothetical protein PTSG_06955 [Salpingoeca rosetta]|eukprot:XP_004992358.1 hypothetical protein PTSG_06955 [Salpingoeca rosetta]
MDDLPSIVGVSARLVREVVAEVQRAFPDTYRKVSTREVCARVVLPWTRARACALVDLYDDKGQEYVGQANVFVSHGWDCCAMDVLDTMLDFASNEQTQQDTARPIYFWLDILVCNQHVSSPDSRAWWGSTLEKTIGEIGQVLLVLSPWHDPVPLTRTWCLWEVFCCLMHESAALSIRVPSTQRSALRNAIVRDYQAIMDTLVHVRVENATASRPLDQEVIWEAIEQQGNGGFARLNKTVKDEMRAWCLRQVEQFVTEMEAEATEPTDTFVELCRQASLVMWRFYEHDKATRFGELALASAIRLFGPRHERVADVCHDLGLIHNSKQDHQGAISYFERELGMSRNLRNRKSRTSEATTLGCLGQAYVGLGQYDRAIELHKKALRIKVAELGQLHELTAISYHDLGEVHKRMGEHHEAVACFEQALQGKLAARGERHPQTAVTLGALGKAYTAIGQYARAVEYLEQALRIEEETLGEEHLSTGVTYHALGAACLHVGDYARAVEYNQKSLHVQLLKLPENHSSLPWSYNNMGLAYLWGGRYDEALTCLKRALNLSTSAAPTADVATTHHNIGFLYHQLQRPHKAVPYFERAIEIRREVQGAQHVDLANTYSRYAAVLLSLGESDRAIAMCEDAVKMCLCSVGETHLATAVAYGSIGDAYSCIDEHATALAYLRKAIELKEQLLDKSHPRTALAYMSLGVAYARCGHCDAGRPLLEKAVAILVARLGEEHPHTQRVQQQLATL